MPTKYEPFDWYATPLYYDIIFDADTAKEADFLEAMLARHATTKRRAGQPVRVLEPACGSGRLVAELAKRGCDVTGFDLSDGMLNFARQRLSESPSGNGHLPSNVTLLNADMTGFRFRKPFDLAVCSVSTFKYLLTEDDARSHLRCVANALKPGGIYVLGFHISDDDQISCLRERWTGERGRTKVVCNIQSWPPDRKSRTEKVRSRLIVTENGTTRRYETVWRFRTYTARQVHSLLRGVPQFEHVATYDMRYDPDTPRDDIDDRYDCVLILRKPK